MTSDVSLRGVRVLLDRYLEVSNHYARELRNHVTEYQNSPSRLSVLIDRLEAIERTAIDPARGAATSALEQQAQGQNIVPTADTLAALRISANEILERLNAPMAAVPHNYWWLRDWLQRDPLEIAAGFPSFTFAWDKMIDLNRLTLVPDSRFLRVRDTVSLATLEFVRFVFALTKLVHTTQTPLQDGVIQGGDSTNIKPEEALESLCTPEVAIFDPLFNSRIRQVLSLLQGRKDSLDQRLIVRDASADTDALALVGLELGFTRWHGFASPSKEHRKAIIMSMLVCSKQFLIETSWQNARDFCVFAINLIARMNGDLKFDPTEGTAMLRFNQFWARHKLGDNISEEVEQWDVSELHTRYSFMRSVLLRKFDDAIRFLETILPKGKTGEAGNFSIAEAEEWPILEEFRSSDQYRDFKRKLDEQVAGKPTRRPESLHK